MNKDRQWLTWPTVEAAKLQNFPRFLALVDDGLKRLECYDSELDSSPVLLALSVAFLLDMHFDHRCTSLNCPVQIVSIRPSIRSWLDAHEPPLSGMFGQHPAVEFADRGLVSHDLCMRFPLLSSEPNLHLRAASHVLPPRASSRQQQHIADLDVGNRDRVALAALAPGVGEEQNLFAYQAVQRRTQDQLREGIGSPDDA
jgi:hypothetical protein